MSRRLSELALGLVPLPPGAGDPLISGLTADSREVKPGCLFAALPGTATDGSRFVPQAVAAGAAAVICAAGASVPPPAIALPTNNPRRTLALMTARFFAAQPDHVVAVTGTNGKTSVTAFVRQIWTSLGFRAASLGTVGVVGPSGGEYLKHTTPDPVTLHAILSRLKGEGVTHLALEASSHGLAQYRLDGVRLAGAGFTNLTRDHLDYHANFDDYFAAKLRLFAELLPAGAPAVVNIDTPSGEMIAGRAAMLGLIVLSVGRGGGYLKLVASQREAFGQYLEIAGPSRRHRVHLPLVGDFQASNVLVAAGLVLATGGDERAAFEALRSLEGAKGRLERVATTTTGAPVFVDYAHTPDALENALAALKPYVKGRLAVVFGCGGDRDRGKRPEMGAIAARLADAVYVTDDNPRGEEPAAIRAEIMAACPGGIEIGDRAAAIHAAIDRLDPGDVLLIAGKGHEEGQIIGKTVIPFSDQAVVRAATGGQGSHG